jgi:hypothetical protein
MKNYLTKLGMVLFIFLTLYSCSSVDNTIKIYSDNRYKPLLKVQAGNYESPQKRNNQDKTDAIGISISGGGSRAQYFGIGVLIGLDEVKKNSKTFLNEIDYFSTVSGGGFGAGYYLSLKKNDVLNDYPNFLAFWNSDERKNNLQEFLYKDAKATSILKLPKYEKNKIKKPYPNMIDYELLQHRKQYKDKTIGELYLSDFFVPAGSGGTVTMPMFVTNGTIYNNGERIPFMPHILNYLHINGSLLPVKPFKSDNGYDFPLCYAITGSAAFPGVLPMLKFSIKDKDKTVIRVIDGGAVDNLGYTTLLELLNKDGLNNSDKKALIVDCSGFGNEIQEQDDRRIKIPPLVAKALLYSVDINLLYSDDNMKYLANYYNLPFGNIKRIGFSTIKNKFIELEATAPDIEKNEINKLKDKIIKKEMNWEDLYKDFASNAAFNGYDLNNISNIPTSSFSNFNIKDIFKLFELSSQIETKIKIYPWEKEILVLAGRFAVYLEQNNIKQLMK